MSRAPHVLLYLNVLVIATCGLIYELLAGTLASYVLGDSVTQWSLVIGIYLSALGVGAWVSRFIEEKVARSFIETELAVALLGGASAPILFYAFGAVDWFRPLLYGMVFAIGTLVGLELPLLMRLLKDELDFSDLVSRVLMWDYIGALLASLLFPMLLVPKLGLVRTSLLFGMLNALVGLWGTYLLRPLLSSRGLAGLRGRAVVTLALLAAAFIKADSLTTLSEETVLPGTVIHAESSPYQRIVVTQNAGGFQLNLNGKLQFNSIDEYRYHEALAHPPLSAGPSVKNLLVLGGGDGLAVREILKWPGVESVTLVDLDPSMTRLAAEFPLLAELNQHALSDPRVSVVNADAFLWVAEPGPRYDAAIIDFPDPGTFAVGKLYSRLFYERLRQRLQPQACISVQCTSPLVAPKSFWCIVTTLEASGYHVRPYQAPVPTFGVWGFVLASPAPLREELALPQEVAGQLRFLNAETLTGLFQLPADLARVPSVVNRLDDQALVRFYDQEWSRLQ